MSLRDTPDQDSLQVTVLPFTRLREDGQVIVGRPERGTFLVLDEEAVEVLDWIADGLSVPEARNRYRVRHGEDLDLQDFLEQLAAKGFVRIGEDRDVPSAREGASADSDSDGARRFHLEWIPPAAARRVVSAPVLAGVGVLVASSAAILAARPHLIPSWEALYFPEGLGLFGSLLAAASLLLVAVHELAHLTAARALGVSCRFGFGTRLWIPVAQTDMTGVWAVPRRKRYLPFLAGPIADATGAACCVLLLFAVDSGLLTAPPPLVRFARGLFLVYIMAILWQGYVFLRTDLYYVLANLLRCKNLMEDTRRFVMNVGARVLPWLEPQSQSHLPAHERRAARWFSLAWIAGRAVALAVLFWIQLPLAWSYLVLLGDAALRRGGADLNHQTIFTGVLGVTTLAVGLTLWIRRLLRRRR